MMFGFLQPGFLWFLPLAGGPLVIHLLTRRRPVVLPFPDLRFIRQASESIIRRHRVHEKWLLVMRCLAIALATLLFARPVFRLSPAAGAVDAGATAVIVLDVSYSMTCREGGRSRLETAKETARALVGLMSPRDRVALILASDSPQAVIPTPVPPQSDRLLAAIAEASATFRSTDLPAALAEAGRILSATAAGDSLKQVILISDLARHGWASRTGTAAMLPKSVAVLAVQVGESEPDNLALGDPRLEEPAGDRIPLTVRVLSPARPRSDGVSILASVEGTRVTEGFARFPSAGAPEVMKTLPLTIGRPGPFAGYAELREPGGAMNVDNRVWFAGTSQPPLRIVVVDGAPGVSSYTGEAYYVRTALAPKSGGNPLVILTQAELDTADLARADAVVLCNPAGLSALARQKLSAHVRRGGGLGLFLGDQADPEKITREFGELLPARLIKRSHGEWSVAWVDESHPALSLLADPAQADWTPVRVTGLIQAEPLESARVLIRLRAQSEGFGQKSYGSEPWGGGGNGPPLVIEGTLADPRAGRIVLIATSADRDWTNLPARPVFLPLLQRLIRHAVRASDPGLAARGLVVGTPGRIPLAARELPSQFDVEWPDGSRSRVAPERSREFTGLDLGVLEQPGIIRVHWRAPDSGEPRETRLAVNLPVASGESDLRRATRAEVEKAIGGSPVAWLSSGPGLEKDYLSAVRGKDASRSIAAALLALLAVELLFASRAPRRGGPSGPPRAGLKAGPYVATALLLLLWTSPAWTVEPQRDQFVFTVLSTRGGSWDLDPTVVDGILQYLTATTSVRVLPGRRAVAAGDPGLFDSPFLCITGHEPFEAFSDSEIEALRRFVTGGGLIFANDAMAARGSGFDRAFRREMSRILPESDWQPLPKDHAVFRAFYLLRQVGGRVIASPTLEGLAWQGRTAIIYTQNDLLGVWARDRLGNYQQACVPGGEPQRMEGMKLTLNVILYALTGTYKTDVIHLPFIQQKLNP